MKLLVIIISLYSSFIITPALAIDFRWDLQVTDTEFELTNHQLDQNKFKAFLPKTTWRCQVSPTRIKGELNLRTISCDYSVKKAGTFSTIISCSKDREYNEVSFDLYDQRKDLLFKVMLLCRKKQPAPSAPKGTENKNE
jgi:hypothetical protein